MVQCSFSYLAHVSAEHMLGIRAPSNEMFANVTKPTYLIHTCLLSHFGMDLDLDGRWTSPISQVIIIKLNIYKYVSIYNWR